MARVASVPAREIIQSANRRASPVLIQAYAMANITRTKKNGLLMKLAAAAPIMAPIVGLAFGGRMAVSWKIGWRASARSDVTAIGIASVDQSTRIPAKSAAMRWP